MKKEKVKINLHPCHFILTEEDGEGNIFLIEDV
jgi:hypothetical protein